MHWNGVGLAVEYAKLQKGAILQHGVGDKDEAIIAMIFLYGTRTVLMASREARRLRGSSSLLPFGNMFQYKFWK